MSVPAFIDLEGHTLIQEIIEYYEGKDISLPPSNDDGDMVADLKNVIGATKNLLEKNTDIPENDVEKILNSIVMLLQVIPIDQCSDQVSDFCDVISNISPCNLYDGARIRTLLNLFWGLEENYMLKFKIYKSAVCLAGQTNNIDRVDPDLEQIAAWMRQWKVSIEQSQDFLRTLHGALLKCGKSDVATKVMLELLGTYTEETASKAREDAQRCIVTHISDPDSYILSNLLLLKPVKILEGEAIHNLLLIFIHGNVSKYLNFHKTNQDWIKSVGLKHEDNLYKMRILTFMSMAESRQEIPFDHLQKELMLEEGEVEDFIIQVVNSQCGLRIRINQIGKSIDVTNTAMRTFGTAQWHLLNKRLDLWQQNLTTVITSLQSVLNANTSS